MAVDLYNHRSKQWVTAEDDSIDELMSSGDYTFEAGIEVPVVTPDGKLGTIPATQAQQAWQQGFRWKTKADRDRWEKEGLADIKKENYDNSLLAGTAGVLSGASLGLSDVAMRGAGALVGQGEAVRSGLANLKEVNPIADTAGRVAGTIGSAILSGGTSAAAQTAGAAGTLAKSATALGTKAATQLGAGKAGQTIAGMAAEGVLWGAGQGVSEAALAESPEQAVDALVSNITLGGVTGGLFGGVMVGGKAASPYLKQAMDSSLDAFAGLGKASARGIAKGIVKPVYWAQGKADLAKKYGDIVNDDDIVKLINEGALDQVDAAVKTKKAMMREVAAEEKNASKYIKATLKDATADEKLAIKSSLDEAGQDVRQALANTQTKLEELGKQYDEFTSTLTGPAVFGETLVKSIDRQLAKLGKYGSDSKAIAKEIAAKTKAYGTGATERSELEMIREIKALVDQTARKDLKGDAHAAAKDLWKQMDDILVDVHPNKMVTEHWKQYNPVYGANKNLEKIFNKSAKKGGGIENLLYSPVTQEKTAKLLGNLNQFTNEFDVIAKAGNNIAKRREAYDLLQSKYRQVTKESLTPENLEALKPIIAEFVSDPKLFKNIDRVEEIRAATMGLESLSPFDATMRLSKLLGKSTDELAKLEKIGKNWETIKALQSQRAGNPLMDVGLGLITSGASLPVTAMKQAAANPIGTIKVMGKVQDAITKGNERLKGLLSKVGKDITSSKAGAALVTYKTSESSKSRDARYKQTKDTLAKMNTPEAMMAAIEQVGGGITGAPQLKLAIGLRLQNGVQYLTANIPKDPLAGHSVFPANSHWVPPTLEMNRFMRKVDAVNNPLDVIARVGQGTATFDEVDAIKNVHPEIYKSLQNSVFSAIMEHGAGIPYSRRIQLGQLFGIPSDISLTPGFITSMQTPFQPQDQGGRPEGSKSNQNIDISPLDSVQTDTDRIRYKV